MAKSSAVATIYQHIKEHIQVLSTNYTIHLCINKTDSIAGEKPYQCPQCSYAASRRDMITRHMRTHSRLSHKSVPTALDADLASPSRDDSAEDEDHMSVGGNDIPSQDENQPSPPLLTRADQSRLAKLQETEDIGKLAGSISVIRVSNEDLTMDKGS